VVAGGLGIGLKMGKSGGMRASWWRDLQIQR